MGISPKTVGRQIKQGMISAKIIPGKYGDEYQLSVGTLAPEVQIKVAW